jgi:hypothetical protein
LQNIASFSFLRFWPLLLFFILLHLSSSSCFTTIPTSLIPTHQTWLAQTLHKVWSAVPFWYASWSLAHNAVIISRWHHSSLKIHRFFHSDSSMLSQDHPLHDPIESIHQAGGSSIFFTEYYRSVLAKLVAFYNYNKSRHSLFAGKTSH